MPLDVGIDDSSVYAPDILWYSEGRAPARHDRPPSPMPDLAAEVRSPSTWRYDIGTKKSGYERHGLRELWLVDTAADGSWSSGDLRLGPRPSTLRWNWTAPQR